MCKLHHIIFHCKIILKSQSLIALAIIILITQVIFLIINVVSFPPPGSLDILIALLRPHYRFHSYIVQRFGFVLHKVKGTRLTMLNLAMKLFRLLWTLKLYHCVKPLVLRSFCSTRSYTRSSILHIKGGTLKTAMRLADSKLESKIRSSSQIIPLYSGSLRPRLPSMPTNKLEKNLIFPRLLTESFRYLLKMSESFS